MRRMYSCEGDPEQAPILQQTCGRRRCEQLLQRACDEYYEENQERDTSAEPQQESNAFVINAHKEQVGGRKNCSNAGRSEKDYPVALITRHHD